jgi:hypothetical protein
MPTFQHPGDRSRFLAGIASQLAYNELDFISLIATSILASLSQKRGISIDWHRSGSNLGYSICSLDSHCCQLLPTIFPHVETASSKKQTTFAPAFHTILGIESSGRNWGQEGDIPAPTGVPTPLPHYLHATAIGGYQLLDALTALVSMTVPLREGQREWIGGQITRVFKIYNIVRS